jgi:hypothetical protein
MTPKSLLLSRPSKIVSSRHCIYKSYLQREQLAKFNLIKFNGGNIRLEEDSIIVPTQEHQCNNLRLVATTNTADLTNSRGAVRKAVTPMDQYIAQRARGAYIVTVLGFKYH